MTTTPNNPADKAATKPFVISRTFDAPRELVWKAWTERERFVQWFGPKGCTISHANMDFRPGGMVHFGMKMAHGKEMWGKMVYREIKAPERIVWINSFSDAAGGITRHPLSPTWPLELLTTASLEDAGNKTKLTIEWLPLNATDEERQTFESMRSSMNQGWGGTFDQLAEYLKHA